MRIDDEGITNKLKEIRRKVGGKRVEFIPRPPETRVDKDLELIQDVEGIFHPSGLLIHNHRPVFAYIRDHTVGGRFDHPRDRKKIHFTVCTTLQNMRQQGRFQRYRLTNRDDNHYLIDVRQGWGKPREQEVRLFPCQYCLGNVRYRCFNYRMEKSAKGKIVEHFDAKEAFDLLWQHFDIFRRKMEEAGAQSATLPTGYGSNWRTKISREIRKSRNFICEECGVRLDKCPRCLDVHHKNADKRDHRDDNLICLCKVCHAKEHPHYRHDSDCHGIIEAARRRQHLSQSRL